MGSMNHKSSHNNANNVNNSNCNHSNHSHSRSNENELTERDISLILTNTALNKQQILDFYSKFKLVYPNGALSKNEFHSLFHKLQFNRRNTRIIDYIYNAFDKDKNGLIDFTEAVISLTILRNGDLIQMLKLIFDVYDLNGDGKINEKEIKQIIESLYDAIDIPKKSRRGVNSPRYRARESIKLFDKNGDRVIDVNEFIEGFFQNTTFSSQIYIYFNYLAENFIDFNIFQSMISL